MVGWLTLSLRIFTNQGVQRAHGGRSVAFADGQPLLSSSPSLDERMQQRKFISQILEHARKIAIELRGAHGGKWIHTRLSPGRKLTRYHFL